MSLAFLGASALVLALVVLVGPRALRALIRRRLLGYRVRVVEADPHRPFAYDPSRPPSTVAIIGGGLAGIAAASTLAERGVSVTLFESKPYLGGKIGAWPHPLASGEVVRVSHGFHAFFRHYYNLWAWLDHLGLRAGFRPIEDYAILAHDQSMLSFRGLESTPVLNLLGLARRGVYRFSDVLFGPARDLMGVFLEYDAETTFARFDRYSLADFDQKAKLPPGLRLAFRTFSRAFFAEEDRVSLAELIKSFHFYYLSHDHGLLYDYPDRDYEAALLAPIRSHLEAHRVRLRLSTPVHELAGQASGYVVNGEPFDRVILAADVVGARAIMAGARNIPVQLDMLSPGQRYAVLRLYVDRDLRRNIPGFVVTDRVRLLDAVTAFHRIEQESAEWVKKHGGAVLELHSYAVPDDLADEAVRGALLDELLLFFPELTGLEIRGESFQLRRDFTAFHTQQWAKRPVTQSGAPGLFLAGDWVKLPFPAMLLEAAFSSGVLAANAVLEELGLSPAPLDAVPSRGLMAGMPEPPARRAAFR